MRDYANKSCAPEKNMSGGNKNGLSNLMLILAILFVGVAAFHYIHKHTALKKPAITAQNDSIPIKATVIKIKKETPALQIKKATPVPTAIANNQPRFDFYKLLPEMTVTIPARDDAANNRANPVTSSTPKTVSASAPGAYVLQIASLPKKSAAKQVENTLKNAGYKTFIQQYQVNNTLWYRVMIGPFDHLKSAAHEQDKLAQHHMPALLLRVSK